MAEPARIGANYQGSGYPLGSVIDDEIAKPSAAWEEMKADRDLVRAIYSGTEEMQSRTDLLRQEPGESDKAYRIRRERTILYNGVEKAVQTIGGKPFMKPIQIGKEASEQFLAWAENIDYTGRSLHVFARDLFTDALLDGIAYFMPEMMAKPKDEMGNVVRMRADQAEAAGKRPYWNQYSADEVIGWLTQLVDGRPALSQVRIVEYHTEASGLFHEAQRKKVRVLYPGYYELWSELPEDDSRRDSKGHYFLEDAGDTTLDFIPLIPVYTKRVAFMRARPPLKSLAWVNLRHWQGGSDQAHVLHVARVPWYFGSGFELEEGEQFIIGPNRFHSRREPEAKIHVIEHSGKAIESGRQDQMDSKEEMASLWTEILNTPSGTMTATETAVRSSESESPAQAMARDYDGALTLGVAYTEKLVGLPESGAKISVFTDFRISQFQSKSVADLREMEANRQISRETLWLELKRRGELDETFNSEEEWKRLKQEAEMELKPEMTPTPFDV